MKRLLTVVTGLLLIGILSLHAFAGDTLDDVKKKGVLVVGVKDSTPPFGSMDNRSGEIIGYDVDIAKAVANKLGVRLEIKPVTSQDRIPQLLDGNIDMIAATMTITADRSKLIDFSSIYFRTTQKFLAKKGTVRSLKDLAGKKIATAKGSTAERNKECGMDIDAGRQRSTLRRIVRRAMIERGSRDLTDIERGYIDFKKDG